MIQSYRGWNNKEPLSTPIRTRKLAEDQPFRPGGRCLSFEIRYFLALSFSAQCLRFIISRGVFRWRATSRDEIGRCDKLSSYVSDDCLLPGTDVMVSRFRNVVGVGTLECVFLSLRSFDAFALVSMSADYRLLCPIPTAFFCCRRVASGATQDGARDERGHSLLTWRCVASRGKLALSCFPG